MNNTLEQRTYTTDEVHRVTGLSMARIWQYCRRVYKTPNSGGQYLLTAEDIRTLEDRKGKIGRPRNAY